MVVSGLCHNTTFIFAFVLFIIDFLHDVCSKDLRYIPSRARCCEGHIESNSRSNFFSYHTVPCLFFAPVAPKITFFLQKFCSVTVLTCDENFFKRTADQLHALNYKNVAMR
jgi:hypothetical protein